jgi:hypothetical protein
MHEYQLGDTKCYSVIIPIFIAFNVGGVILYYFSHCQTMIVMLRNVPRNMIEITTNLMHNSCVVSIPLFTIDLTDTVKRTLMLPCRIAAERI